MMESISTFLNMGGHGVFIWPSYLLSALVLILLLVFSLNFRKNMEAALGAFRDEKDAHK
ncbi:MAG: heme exporter protein CcmD [Rhodospirillales bacterium]|nr:heme exporter protein CcmD [Rhodospirillales bacterium]